MTGYCLSTEIRELRENKVPMKSAEFRVLSAELKRPPTSLARLRQERGGVSTNSSIKRFRLTSGGAFTKCKSTEYPLIYSALRTQHSVLSMVNRVSTLLYERLRQRQAQGIAVRRFAQLPRSRNPAGWDTINPHIPTFRNQTGLLYIIQQI
ncbi:hypothetical protein Cal7507_4437 [Calothrix sp. PCC 7507]|nr:hypothetical protein Cal7507_4437 [Calothrix sp. PCC 7507]